MPEVDGGKYIAKAFTFLLAGRFLYPKRKYTIFYTLAVLRVYRSVTSKEFLGWIVIDGLNQQRYMMMDFFMLLFLFHLLLT